MIKEIYRGNGLTELIVEGEEDESERICKTDEPNFGNLHDTAAGIMHRNKGTVKGCYCGRNGSTVVLNRLLCSGREDKK